MNQAANEATELSAEEYLALSSQKADDWRSISAVNPTLFGVAGALFAAGVTQHQAFVVVMSPLPLFLGVWHMVRQARLQLQMVTYLSHHAPVGYASWERDLDAVRAEYVDRRARAAPRWLKFGHERPPHWISRLMLPSAWNTWLAISVVVGFGADLVPLILKHGDQYEDAVRALLLGLGLIVASIAVISRQAARVQTDRDLWSELWEKHRGKPSGSQARNEST